MAGVLQMVGVLMLHALGSSTVSTTPQGYAQDHRPLRPVAFHMVQQHLLSLSRAQNGRADGARFLQEAATRDLPGWFQDRADCYIEYCNHYADLQRSFCCPASARKVARANGGVYCDDIPRPTCTADVGRQIRDCKSHAIGVGLVDGHMKRHIFSPSCGGLSQVNSTVHHNGTHFVREVKAKWNCVFPDGTCFHNHAPLEGLPDQMQDCVTEENEGPLKVKFVIDLHCAHMDSQIHCDSNLNTQPFDPFATCTNDPNLLKATCHLGCSNGYAREYCTFEFDSIGAYNMSDRTIDTCSLHAQCSSPYVEANAMFCSSHQGQSHFKPHWESRPLPKRGIADHGIRGPPLPGVQVEMPRSRVLSLVLWLIAIVSLALGAAFLALRAGILPESWVDQLESVMTSVTGPSVRNIGAPYRAPPVYTTSRDSHYVAPAPSSHVEHGRDQELEKIVGEEEGF